MNHRTRHSHKLLLSTGKLAGIQIFLANHLKAIERVSQTDQAATIGGFLRYTTNRLQLMGTFLAPTGVTLQQAAAIDYVNSVLISGQAGTALLAAVPSLLQSDGAMLDWIAVPDFLAACR